MPPPAMQPALTRVRLNYYRCYSVGFLIIISYNYIYIYIRLYGSPEPILVIKAPILNRYSTVALVVTLAGPLLKGTFKSDPILATKAPLLFGFREIRFRALGRA